MDRLPKLEPILLTPFIQMHTSIISSVKKAKSIYEHESSVVRNLLFAQNVGETDKIKAFSYEWTQYPSSLFQPDEHHTTGNAR